MTRSPLDNLKTYQTPKERVRAALWAALRVFVLCYVSWDLSAYLIDFWETWNVWRLITPAVLAVVLVYTLQMVDIRRRRWLIIPTIVALVVPVVLHALDQRVQPSHRVLSDAYKSALAR